MMTMATTSPLSLTLTLSLPSTTTFVTVAINYLTNVVDGTDTHTHLPLISATSLQEVLLILRFATSG